LKGTFVKKSVRKIIETILFAIIVLFNKKKKTILFVNMVVDKNESIKKSSIPTTTIKTKRVFLKVLAGQFINDLSEY